jgi:hypothetical protein
MNPDCCENGGKGSYCCTNGVDNPNCELPTPPPLPSFIPIPNLPKVIPILPQEEIVQELDERIEKEDVIVEAPETVFIPQTPPPLPSFIPIINLPKIIPIISSSPAPFQPAPKPVEPAPLPIKPVPIPQIQSRTFATTTKSPNEYLPPFDVRSGDIIDWNSWKVKER